MLKWFVLLLLAVSCTEKPPVQYTAILDNGIVRENLMAYIQRNPIDSTKLYYLEVTQQGDSTEVEMTSLIDLESMQYLQPCDLMQLGDHLVLVVASACARLPPLDLPALAKQHGLPRSVNRVTLHIEPNGDTVEFHKAVLYCPPTLKIKLHHDQVVRVL
ncbi:hypothetical protein GCM10027348_35430 [Hymenobacter tenuis]